MDGIGNRLWDSLQVFDTGSIDGNGNASANGPQDSSFGAFLNKTVGSVDPFGITQTITDSKHSDKNQKNSGTFNNSVNGNSEPGKSIPKNKSQGNSNTSSTKPSYANANTGSGGSYADKFMERIISMAIPTTTTSSKRELDRILGRIEMQKTRPQLSMQIMSTNSILLTQRLSVPFEIIDWLINFIDWKNPIITITGMIFVSLCILKPINFFTIPIFYICFEIIIPAYNLQNPNNDSSVKTWENELPKPVNEFSREFLLNVTDLQNHMVLYIHSWDFIVDWCYKLFYFRDEMLTWFIFVSLLICGLFIETFGTRLIVFFFPFLKLALLIISWAVIIALHPNYRNKILETFYSEEVRLKTVSLLNHYEFKLIKDLEINIDDLEIRQIEIFELQYFNETTKTWQFVCFSKDPYPTNDHIRLNNLSIEGTLTLDNISPPEGWKFVNTEDLSYRNISSIDDNEVKESKDGVHAINFISNDSKNQSHLLLFDSEKKKILREKKKHQKNLEKQKKEMKLLQNKGKKAVSKKREFIVNKPTESKQSNINRRRASNDFSQVLLDPLLLNRKVVQQLETGVKLDGWYMDLNPDLWVNDNYLNGVFEIDENTKWVYDLVVMGNGVHAYSAGLGVGLGVSKDKLKRSRGDVRRRRWVRYAVREIINGLNEENEIDVVEESDTGIDTEHEVGTADEGANEIESEDDVQNKDLEEEQE